jgi:hypothetical protein
MPPTETTDPTQALTPAPSVPLQPPPPKTPIRMGMAPQNFEDGYRLAKLMSDSGLVPEGFRGKPADVLVAIEMGLEVGLAPMQALQSIAVINGRPSIWGDGFLALIQSSSLYVSHDEYYEVKGERREGLLAEDFKHDDTAAVCTFVRRGAKPVTRRFSIAQAKKAELWAKKGPWQTYPDRMMAMRARSYAGRDSFADLLRGIRTAEEAQDLTTGEGEFDDAPVREVRRISETKPASPPISAPVVQAVTLGPVHVTKVEAFLGGWTVTLGTGQTIDAIDEKQALDLEQFVGTPHRVTVVCEKVEQGLTVKSFAIAD